ncbi:unnamed protein product [Linum trigynum]|uniref:Uncharacterized protein n=1 Tax=Linum trigynum TaxID=586398 RepID=A0AAV2EQ59_9ROSI
MKRRRVHESRHVFHESPFEAYCCGSCRGVRQIEIRDGDMITHYGDNHPGVEDKGLLPNLQEESPAGETRN